MKIGIQARNVGYSLGTLHRCALLLTFGKMQQCINHNNILKVKVKNMQTLKDWMISNCFLVSKALDLQ